MFCDCSRVQGEECNWLTPPIVTPPKPWPTIKGTLYIQYTDVSYHSDHCMLP